MERNYNVYRASSRQRRKKVGQSNRVRKSLDDEKAFSRKGKIRGIKLAVCLAVLFTAVVVKLAVPGAINDMRDRMLGVISGNVDYKAAISTLGKAVSGDKKLSDAIPEAYAYTFGIIDGSEGEEYSKVSAVKDNEEESAEKKGVSIITHRGIALPESIADEAKTEAQDEKNTENAKISAFKESQAQYSDFSKPENVSYEMPNIDFEYKSPLEAVITSPFGYRVHPEDRTVKFHYGIDMGAEQGSEVLAFADGEVQAVGDSSSYGNYIIVQHQNGIKTLYAHCSEIVAQQGASVSKSEVIAKVGDTGNATSSCLHFEIMRDGIYLNPEYYI